MGRSSFAIIVMLLLAGGSARAQGEADLQKASAALEKALVKIIEKHEGAIACILVSRSDLYEEFGQGPDKDKPGVLGTFDVRHFEDHPRIRGESSKEKRLHFLKLLDFTHPGYVPRSFGSGVVIDAKGLILTNYHVVQDATKIFVRLPGTRGSYADIHAADPRCDLAVLKLRDTSLLPLPTIKLGDADKLQRGNFVLTLANPYAAGYRDGQPSASYGIISNIRRRSLAHLKEEERIKPLHYYATLLQTDARLHLGCSGGALLNLSGEMVGLLTSAAAIQGFETPGGFAIPLHAGMRRIIDVLKRGEEVDYGFLGVGFDERNTSGKPGVPLTLVGQGSPADIDGRLKPGDVLLAVNGQPIHDSDDIYTTIGAHLTGTKVKLHVKKSDGVRDVEVTLAKLLVPGKKIASSLGNRPFIHGLRVDHTSLIAQKPSGSFHIPRGVLITDVQRTSAAERANLKSGDVVTHVNGVVIATPAAFYEAMAKAVGGIELTMYNFPPVDPPTKIQLK
ncbi:MAG: trypsin-like peptidase domain-containing protein [Planctomycetes bacterium]|nr:trypsin-like peptidase domain-containing protein [Planctomycetota bacterium]